MLYAKLNIACPVCGRTHTVWCSREGFFRWQGGELVQDALPELSATEREQLLSGLCPECQAWLFGE